MASRACPNPVQAVARAARLRSARNALIAVGAVLATAFGVTVGMVWPVGQHTVTSCSAGHTLVAVRPFAAPPDATGRWISDDTRMVPVPVVTGCLDRADLVPAGRADADGRG
ncbi:MAG TPA: hypothetical protein VIS06_13665 [Mycobacteriales bacterium]